MKLLLLLAALNMADRLVVAINNQSYSQREVETYMVIKNILSTQQVQKDYLVTRDNWPEILNRFVEEKMIAQDAESIGSFNPTAEMIERAENIYLRMRNNRQDIRNVIFKYRIQHDEVMTIIRSILRVEIYKRSKSGALDPSKNLENYRDSAWMKKLRRESVVRYFEGAKTYQELVYF